MTGPINVNLFHTQTYHCNRVYPNSQFSHTDCLSETPLVVNNHTLQQHLPLFTTSELVSPARTLCALSPGALTANTAATQVSSSVLLTISPQLLDHRALTTSAALLVAAETVMSPGRGTPSGVNSAAAGASRTRHRSAVFQTVRNCSGGLSPRGLGAFVLI